MDSFRKYDNKRKQTDNKKNSNKKVKTKITSDYDIEAILDEHLNDDDEVQRIFGNDQNDVTQFTENQSTMFNIGLNEFINSRAASEIILESSNSRGDFDLNIKIGEKQHKLDPKSKLGQIETILKRHEIVEDEIIENTNNNINSNNQNKKKQVKAKNTLLSEFDFKTKVGEMIEIPNRKKNVHKTQIYHCSENDPSGDPVLWFLKYLDAQTAKTLQQDSQFDNIQNILYPFIVFKQQVENGEKSDIKNINDNVWLDIKLREETLRNNKINTASHALIFPTKCMDVIDSILFFTYTYFECVLINRISFNKAYIVTRISDTNKYGILFEFDILKFVKDDRPFTPQVRDNKEFKEKRKWRIFDKTYLEKAMFSLDLGDVDQMIIHFNNYYYVEMTGIDVMIKNPFYSL
jgi:hypothetical protein